MISNGYTMTWTAINARKGMVGEAAEIAIPRSGRPPDDLPTIEFCVGAKVAKFIG